MSSFLVEPCRAVSHHEAASLPNTQTRKKRNKHMCRGASSRWLPSSRALQALFAIIISLTLIGTTSAADVDRPTFLAIHVEDDLGWKGSALHIDHRPPPIISPLMPLIHYDEGRTDAESASLPRRAVKTSPNVRRSDFTVPEPFDTGLSNNFTSSCAAFLTRLRTSEEFRKCHPFSLLLQTSQGFFEASRKSVLITQTLDATCGVNSMQQCNNLMQAFARELMTASACKTDLASDNPLVIQALNGLIAYPVAFAASCLKDTSSAAEPGSYCFSNAVTNRSSSTDSYPYYLPVGQELPAGSRPTCNQCLQDQMAIYSQYGNNLTQPISKTYSSAAQQLSIACGRSFVNVTAAPLKAAASTKSASLTPTLTLILMFVLYFFQ